jgi:hypothetical protein
MARSSVVAPAATGRHECRFQLAPQRRSVPRSFSSHRTTLIGAPVRRRPELKACGECGFTCNRRLQQGGTMSTPQRHLAFALRLSY